ncbi:MAG: DUF4330 domain-containing protein [Ruminococcaceae bacterium]|nr:DUF4330 domain-containing protein [Oscillospiraceae bacterium]
MKQKTNSFNIIDFLIILLALAIIGVGVYLLFFRQSTQEKVKIDYTIEMEFVRSEFNDLIKVGDTVISTVAHDVMGTVVNVEYSNAESTTTNIENGEKKLTTYPDNAFSKVIITVRTDAVYEKNAYYVGAIGLYVGSTVYFRVPSYIGGATCIDVKPVESPKA